MLTSGEFRETDEILVDVERARVEFGSLVAVRDVSLKLRGGDLLGLIGPNGAGKTTLLRAIAGLQPLACGRIRLMGETFRVHEPRVLRYIGFTADNPAVYEELTVRQFLRTIAIGYDLDVNEHDSLIDFWLERVWLTEKADQKIKALSRGMRQRIGIARTMLPNPTIVLLDEPAAGLDPAGRVQFRQLLSSLRKQGKALIVSSHILADMSEYCTHIGIMAGGSIVQYGTVAAFAGQAEHGRCRYTVTLARAVTGLPELLDRLPGVDHVDLDGDRFTLEYDSDRSKAAELLAHLVREGVPIASFAAHVPDLEEAYLRTGIRQVD